MSKYSEKNSRVLAATSRPKRPCSTSPIVVYTLTVIGFASAGCLGVAVVSINSISPTTKATSYYVYKKL